MKRLLTIGVLLAVCATVCATVCAAITVVTVQRAHDAALPWTDSDHTNSVLRWDATDGTNASGHQIDSSAVGTNVGVIYKYSSAATPPILLPAFPDVRQRWMFRSTATTVTNFIVAETDDLEFDANSPFTIRVWLRRGNTAAAFDFAKETANAKHGPAVYNGSAAGSNVFARLKYTGATNLLNAQNYYTDGQWRQETLRYNGTNVDFILNGQIVATVATNANLMSNSSFFRVGGIPSYAASFTGEIGEVTVYNKAVTTTNEYEYFRNTATGFAYGAYIIKDRYSWYTNMRAWYDFDYATEFNTTFYSAQDNSTNLCYARSVAPSYPTYQTDGTNGYLYVSVDDGMWNQYDRVGIGQQHVTGNNGTELSVAMWLRPQSVGALLYYPFALYDGAVASNVWSIRVGGTYSDATWTSNAISVYDHTQDKMATTVANVWTTADTNIWHFVVVTWDSNASPNMAIYKDNVLLTLATNQLNYVPAHYGFMLGTRADWAFGFVGNIDQYMILPWAMSAAEVEDLWNARKGRYYR